MVPESPRWLIVKNKTDEAYVIFKRVAKSNGKSIDSLNELEPLVLDKTYNPKTEEEEEDKEDEKEVVFCFVWKNLTI